MSIRDLFSVQKQALTRSTVCSAFYTAQSAPQENRGRYSVPGKKAV